MLGILQILAMILGLLAVCTEVYAVDKQSPLDKDFVEQGTVVKFPVPVLWLWRTLAKAILLSDIRKTVRKVTAIAFLSVETGAKIASHKHENDNERYFLLTWRGLLVRVSQCLMGEEHEWANPLPKNAILLTVKWE